MRRMITIATVTIVAGFAGAASAHDSGTLCKKDHDGQQFSRQKFRRDLDALGYDINRLRTKRGCIEAHLTDRGSSGKVRAIFDATTGELLRARPAS